MLQFQLASLPEWFRARHVLVRAVIENEEEKKSSASSEQARSVRSNKRSRHWQSESFSASLSTI